MSDLPASALHCRLILKSEVPRCSLCGLIEPCRHHAKPNDANCSESKSASELDQVSETIMLEHGKKQERGSCQEYERSGTCRRLEWYGSCPYWHPEQEVKPPIIVERCDVCTLPLPCFSAQLGRRALESIFQGQKITCSFSDAKHRVDSDDERIVTALWVEGAIARRAGGKSAVELERCVEDAKWKHRLAQSVIYYIMINASFVRSLSTSTI